MKPMILACVLACLSLAGGTAPALAQAAAGDKQAAAAPAAATDQLAPVFDLISSSKWKADSFAHLKDVSGHAYPLATWVNDSNRAALKSALEANASQIAELHAAISASAPLTEWLKQQNIEVSQVVAVGVTTGGSLAVFTN